MRGDFWLIYHESKSWASSRRLTAALVLIEVQNCLNLIGGFSRAHLKPRCSRKLHRLPQSAVSMNPNVCQESSRIISYCVVDTLTKDM